MKSVRTILLSITALVLVITAAPVAAQTPTDMTDDHIARIRTNCPLTLATLGQIHANDAPQYINRNQTYFSISDKMMARFNGRLALNRYDASQLVSIANEYNVVLAKFRTTYKQYDDSMSDLLKMNCQKEPVTFYDKVGGVREQRQKVHVTTQQLKALIGKYGQAVRDFRSQHTAELTGGGNE